MLRRIAQSAFLWTSAVLIALGGPALAGAPNALRFEPVPEPALAKPVFPAGATVPPTSGLVVVRDRVIYAAKWESDGGKTAGLWVHGPKDGPGRRVATEGDVLGLAHAADDGLLYVRTAERILVLGAEDLIERSRYDFERANSWTDLAIHGGRLVALSRNRLRFFDPATGRALGESPQLPLSRTQRVLSCGGRLFLWSSYSGARLYSYNIESQAMGAAMPVDAPHRALFKLACHQGSPAVFDPGTGIHASFHEFAGRFVRRGLGLSVLPDGGALRSRPRHDEITYELRVKPSKDAIGARALVLLPPKSTIIQDLEDEQFPKASEIILDRDGNRGLSVELPAQRAGVPFALVVYRARLTRYRVDVDLTRYRTGLRATLPDELRPYTVDIPQLLIADPEITQTRDRLLSGAATMEDYATAAFREVKTRLHYKGDGRFDPAPVVLKQRHGSCTEYTYALMALFRSAGIPARMAWNHLGQTEPRFNHKIPELWHPNLGWIPAEALAPPATTPGTTYARHLIFAELRTPFQEWMGRADRLVSLRGVRGRADLIVRFTGHKPAAGEGAPAQARPPVRGRGARRVVE